MKIYCMYLTVLFSMLISCTEEKKSIPNEEVITEAKLEPQKDTLVVLPEEVTNVDSLKNTSFSAYATVGIKKEKNIIYSGGASIGWKELKKITGQKTLRLINGPNWLSKLETDPLVKDDIDSKAFRIIAGNGQAVADSLTKIEGQTVDDSLMDHAIIVTVKVFKQLKFPEEIKSSASEGGLSDFHFMNKKVEHNFIHGSSAFDPFSIYDYKNDNHFIVQIPVEDDNFSEVILAKISPLPTLQETYTYVMNRKTDKYYEPFYHDDKIAFPSVVFNLTKQYKDLLKPIAGTDLHISVFEQNLKFGLTNKGLILEDYTRAMADSVVKDPPKPKKLYFNSPFLIILKEKKSKTPYFLMWVGNTELMKEEK